MGDVWQRTYDTLARVSERLDYTGGDSKDKKIVRDSLVENVREMLGLLTKFNVTDDQRMELCYYALIQNRIEEAITWFDQVKVDQLATRLQGISTKY